MWVTWREAIERALYGEAGFYLHQRPSRHYRTSVGVSPVFAQAILRLLTDVDARLGHPDPLDFVDVGAGDGTLAVGVLSFAPPELAERLRITAVERAPRPEGLTPRIDWAPVAPDRLRGLVIANEWLDNIPLDLAEQTARGPRLVLVDPRTGAERLGPEPDDEDIAWIARWWPLTTPGDRAEIGRTRDQAWAALIGKLERGLAVAADYSHPVDNRPLGGTLTAYREGRTVPPVPDGSCDITAHVALDACAEAGHGAGATGTKLTTQREAMIALGVTGVRPPLHLAHADPRRYLRALARSSEEAELIAPSGLGGFGWLTQEVDLA
ncbi:SAM-dependent methyltransferase [Thermopolyspora sp. NPDC052614]|uniref:SAM-dependent methyltransferase n=1 Tax=Thermopolyspora sp. NPDC052614 TaxID=3155682 RepID=UPI003425E467